MYVRITTTDLSPGEVDASAEVFEQVIPSVNELEGFAGMYVFSELNGRRIVALSFWNTEAALQGAEPVMNKLRDAESAFRRVEAQETKTFRVSGSALVPS